MGMQVLMTVIGGAVGAAIVSGIFGIIMWKLNRKAQVEDRQEDKEQESADALKGEVETINEQLSGLTVAMRMLMYDRIKHLGNSYLKRDSISSEELADLIEMHLVYHDTLKGNGFLDTLMEKVKALPVKG